MPSRRHGGRRIERAGVVGMLIESGSRDALFLGCACAPVLICAAALIAAVSGLDAERKPLEEIARPLCAR